MLVEKFTSKVKILIFIIFLLATLMYSSVSSTAGPIGLVLSENTPSTMMVGQEQEVRLLINNQSNFTWSSRGLNPIYISYYWLDEKGMRINEESIKTRLPQNISPGTSHWVNVVLQAPSKPGSLNLVWDIYQTGYGWFTDHGSQGVKVPVKIETDYSLSWQGQNSPQVFYCGTKAPVIFLIKNTSNMVWMKQGVNPVRLGYRWLDASSRKLIEEGSLRTQLPSDVKPGQTVEVRAETKAPGKPGKYILQWDLLHEHITWFSGKGTQVMEQESEVDADYKVVWQKFKAESKLNINKEYSFKVTVKNNGFMTWLSSGPYKVVMTYHWIDKQGRTIVKGGFPRNNLKYDLKSKETQTIKGTFRTPSKPGKYTLKIDLLHVGLDYFSDQGADTKDIKIKVGEIYYKNYIVVDFSDKKLYFYDKYGDVQMYPVAIGKPGTPTPARNWLILEKNFRSMTAPASARFMRLFYWNGYSWARTGYGIHGTPWPWTVGTAASHGCIRMYNSDALKLYPQVPLGTQVTTRP